MSGRSRDRPARCVVIVKRLNEQLVGHVGDVVDRECTSRPLNIFSSKDRFWFIY